MTLRRVRLWKLLLLSNLLGRDWVPTTLLEKQKTWQRCRVFLSWIICHCEEVRQSNPVINAHPKGLLRYARNDRTSHSRISLEKLVSSANFSARSFIRNISRASSRDSSVSMRSRSNASWSEYPGMRVL